MAQLSDVQKQLEFLRKLQSIESGLYRPGIEDEFEDLNEKEQFKQDRSQFSLYVQKLQANTARVLVDKLEENNKEFENGIKNLEKESQSINDTVAYLQLFGQVLGMIGKIVGILG